MNQSSTLGRLNSILKEAVETGNEKEVAGVVLTRTMGSATVPQNVVDFYEILNKAEEEARKLGLDEGIDESIRVIKKLKEFFIVNHLWKQPWNIFADYIRNTNVLGTLGLLARTLQRENPHIYLEESFLEELTTQFNSLLSSVLGSTLSKDLKAYLLTKIEDILGAIRRYSIDGTEGLEKAAKTSVADLLITDSQLKEEDKKNPIFQKFTAMVTSLALFLAPTSIYDIIGLVDAQGYRIPKYQEIVEEIERIIPNESNIQNIFEQAAAVLINNERKRLTGKETKYLPASREDEENQSENEGSPNSDQRLNSSIQSSP